MSALIREYHSLKSPISHIYKHSLLEHHKNPIGFKTLQEATHRAEGAIAACGDEIVIEANVVKGEIIDIGFSGSSCAICRASASLLCQHFVGHSIGQVEHIAIDVIDALKSSEQGALNFNETLQPLFAVKEFPVRRQCAILPWATFKVALTQ